MNQELRDRLVALAKTEDLTWRFWGDKVIARAWTSTTEWRALTVSEQRELATLLEDKVLVKHNNTIGRGYYVYRKGG